MTYIIIDPDDYYELVEKEGKRTWIEVKPFTDMQKAFIEIQKMKFPDDMLTHKSLVKELCKQKLIEIMSSNRFWFEVKK